MYIDERDSTACASAMTPTCIFKHSRTPVNPLKAGGSSRASCYGYAYQCLSRCMIYVGGRTWYSSWKSVTVRMEAPLSIPHIEALLEAHAARTTVELNRLHDAITKIATSVTEIQREVTPHKRSHAESRLPSEAQHSHQTASIDRTPLRSAHFDRVASLLAPMASIDRTPPRSVHFDRLPSPPARAATTGLSHRPQGLSPCDTAGAVERHNGDSVAGHQRRQPHESAGEALLRGALLRAAGTCAAPDEVAQLISYGADVNEIDAVRVRGGWAAAALELLLFTCLHLGGLPAVVMERTALGRTAGQHRRRVCAC